MSEEARFEALIRTWTSGVRKGTGALRPYEYMLAAVPTPHGDFKTLDPANRFLSILAAAVRPKLRGRQRSVSGVALPVNEPGQGCAVITPSRSSHVMSSNAASLKQISLTDDHPSIQ
jgi:hypothetical protein